MGVRKGSRIVLNVAFSLILIFSIAGIFKQGIQDVAGTVDGDAQGVFGIGGIVSPKKLDEFGRGNNLIPTQNEVSNQRPYLTGPVAAV